MSATGERGSPPASDAGTTLVEALVVVAIVTLVSVIAFPRLQQGLLRLAQQQTVAVVAARLRESRAAALRNDRQVVFAVSRDGRAYGSADGPVSRTPSGVTLVPADGGGRAIAFHGDGSSSGGGVWVMAARRAVPVSVDRVGALVVGGR